MKKLLLLLAVLAFAGCTAPVEQLEESETPEVEVEEVTTGEAVSYVNDSLGFTFHIPDGYWVNDRDGRVHVIYGSPEDQSVPDLEINATPLGNAPQDYGEREGCDVEVIFGEEYVYQIRTWECIESPVFEDVVSSFELI